MSAADRDREARRMVRLAALGLARNACGEAIQHIADGVAGRLPEDQQYRFNGVADPYLALSRVVTTLGRIVVLEERLDESAEERSNRLAGEAAAAEKARKAEQTRQERAAAEAADTEKKAHIRRAIELSFCDAKPNMRPIDRLHEIEELFAEFDGYDDYSRDPVEIVADLCDQMGFAPVIPPGAKIKAKDKAASADLARLNAMETARDYLHRTAPDPDTAPTTPPTRAQGPPNA